MILKFSYNFIYQFYRILVFLPASAREVQRILQNLSCSGTHTFPVPILVPIFAYFSLNVLVLMPGIKSLFSYGVYLIYLLLNVTCGIIYWIREILMCVLFC